MKRGHCKAPTPDETTMPPAIQACICLRDHAGVALHDMAYGMVDHLCRRLRQLQLISMQPCAVSLLLLYMAA